MAERVCIPNFDQTHPTYHKIKVRGATAEHRHWTWHAGCNAAVVDHTYGIKSIRRERAELFARPCRRCFREDADRG